MKSKDLKIIAVILAVALVFTVLASNAVSVASIVFLAKNDIQGAPAQQQQQAQPQQQQQSSNVTPGGNTSTTPDATQPSGDNGSTATPDATQPSGDNGSNATPDANKPADNNGGATANAWDKAKVYNFYKDAAHNLATKGNAGYDKIEWQVLENLQVGSVGSVLQPVIDSFMTTKEEAEVQVQAKGSDDAKNRFPDCTLTDLSKIKSAEKKDLPNGNYEITIIMVDEDTPMNEESSFLAKVTSSVLFWEDIEETIKNDVPVVSAINSRSVNYKGYKITAEMTKDGKFVKLGHYATVDIKANAKITMFTLDIGGTLYNNCEYSNFKY